MQTSTIFSLLDVPIDFGGFLFTSSPGFDSVLLFLSPDVTGFQFSDLVLFFSPLYYSHLQLKMPFQRKTKVPTSHLSFCSPLRIFLCILDAGPDSHSHTHIHTHCSSLSLGSHIVYMEAFSMAKVHISIQFHLVTHYRYIWHFFPPPPLPYKKVGKSNFLNTSVIKSRAQFHALLVDMICLVILPSRL